MCICTRGAPDADKLTTPSGGAPTQGSAPLVQGGTPSTQRGISTDPSPCLNPQANAFSPATTSAMYAGANPGVLLQTAKVQVCNPDRLGSPVNVRVILDSGSQRSYITRRTSDTLSLDLSHKQKMLIKTFGAEKEEERDCEIVKVAMKTVDGAFLELSLFTVPLICEPLTHQPLAICQEKYEHLAHLTLADSCDEEDMSIDVLIGLDYFWQITTDQVIRGSSGPTAVYTRFGWVLSGPTGIPGHCTSSVNVITSHILRCDSRLRGGEDLDSTLRMFWELESLGVNSEDSAVVKNFDREITFKNGRYQVSLPWKPSHEALPDNYHLSKKRLLSLLRRLKQNPSILKEYDATIKDQLSRGIVEVVGDIGSQPQPPGPIHYLPHHAVIKWDKQTSKLRIVYDASARGDGPSLNDCLLVGPKFGQSIMDIVLRFRVHSVALMSDIEKAFLMISVSPTDRDVLRFLWIDDVAKDDPQIITLRFTRVVFGVSSSPFLLNATVQHHLQDYSLSHPETVKKICHSIYVDDIASGANSDDSAYKLYSDAKAILKEGGFNLRKFVTNSPELQKKIDEKEHIMQLHPTDADPESYTKTTLGATQTVKAGETKVLGVKWNPSMDSLVFDFNDVFAQVSNSEPTKRNVVGAASKFYDPLGVVSPVTIRFKALFQELCEAKLD